MIQSTLDRLLPLVPASNHWVVTNEQHAMETCRQLATQRFCASQLLAEPVGRNTAAAIGFAARILGESDPDTIMGVFPADHAITTPEPFLDLLKEAEAVAQKGHLVTLGIQPSAPETGYGYIKQGAALDGSGFSVDQFVEKPDAQTAAHYLKEGGYYWNSGMFVWKVSVLLDELKTHLPKLYEQLDTIVANTLEVKGRYPYRKLNKIGREIFKSLEPISIDYGVMEKSDKAVVLPANIGWNDVGAWTALTEVSTKDSEGNVVEGKVVTIDSTGSIIHGSDRLIAALGVNDLIVVDTPDALLVCAKNRAQDVRKVVERIKKENHPEAVTSCTENRPWGTYTVLQKETNYLVKRIEVFPGESLSLQSHEHRSEHWTITTGTAEVQVKDNIQTLTRNQSIHIPKGAKPRLTNPGSDSLIIIEVQIGDKLDEDDITRYEDKYDRI